MTFQVELRSRDQILGDLIRSILANTDLNDVAPGSTLATMLESIATSQYQISLGSLKILENSNLESLVGNALDQKAQSMRLPNSIGGIGRIPAGQSSGIVTIGSGFSKQSTKFYAGKPAPFAGSKKLYVEDSSLFGASGRIYIGRGTADRFEGPINFTSTEDMGSFWVINLATPLTKNHLYSDLIVLAQGGNRTVSAGTVVQTAASNEVPSVSFTASASAVLPDGEAEVDVSVTCTQFGEAGNALGGAIRQFASLPFPGATVTNKTSFQNGRSTESDEDLRKRIKNYPSTLSRGTKAAILAAIQGIADPDTGRTITSATVVSPAEPGDYSRVYIDDGSGLEPTFSVQPYELLLQAASGQETTFQMAQFPITPATAVGAEVGPFVVQSGQKIVVVVDGVTETYQITASNYVNLNAATAYELVRDFNSQSNIVGFRTVDGGKRIVMIDRSGVTETLQVLAGDLQKILGFPTAIVRPIFVYQDAVLKSFRGQTATLMTAAYPWTLVPTDVQNLPVLVDGVEQTVNITNSDFVEFSTNISTATLSQWAVIFSRKIAGVQFSVAGNRLIWTSRQTFSPLGTLEIPEKRSDGSLVPWIGTDKIWASVSDGGVLYDAGTQRDYLLNRFTGEIRFTTKPPVGTTIEVGTRNTRAHVPSIETPTGLYTLSPFAGTIGNARMVLGFDGEFAVRYVGIALGDKITPSVPDPTGAPNVVRLTANNAAMFTNARVGDYLYLIKDASAVPLWGSNIEGIYVLKSVGMNGAAVATDFYAVPVKTTSGSSTVEVTMDGHGYKTGALITVATSVAVGGISSGNLSQTSTPITVLDGSRFTYEAAATASSTAAGAIDQLTYLADAWVEIEVSSIQLVDWSLIMGASQSIMAGTVYVFKSKGAIPQIVDFGPIGTVSVDSVVSIINGQIACGQAAKVNGRQFAIRSADWVNGTVAVLATVANASSMILTGISVSQQSHTANSTSGHVHGSFPVVSAIVNQDSDLPTRAYLKVDRDLLDITANTEDPAVESSSPVTTYPEGFEGLWLTGRQAGLAGRIYNNEITTPFAGILRSTKSIGPLQTSDAYQTSTSTLDRYANYLLRLRDLPIAADDRLVVEFDLDPVDKTVSIPLFKRAEIMDMDALTGFGRGQVVSFRLADSEDWVDTDFDNIVDTPLPFFDTASIYSGFDFADFKLLTRTVGLYRETDGIDMVPIGSLTALPANDVTGVQDGDTFELSDGVLAPLTFEFDSNAAITGDVAVTIVAGAHPTGSLTAIGMGPGALSEGDTFTLSDGVNTLLTFEFDSDLSYVVGNIPISYVAGAYATGQLTAYAADPLTGLKDGDTFVLKDGINTVTFEFDDNAAVTPGNVAVTILSVYTAPQVRLAMIAAINGVGAGLAVTAIPGVGDTIDLANDTIGVAGNQAVTETIVNIGVTLYPVGMSGGIDHATATTIEGLMVAAINGASPLNISATAGIPITLLNSVEGAAGNVTITESIATSATLTPVGMANGVDGSSVTAVQAAMITAINGSGLALSAYAGQNGQVLIVNDVDGPAGNVPIPTPVIASLMSMFPTGMSGGSLAAPTGNRAIVLRSTGFGTDSELRLALRLPTEPSVGDILVTHSNDFVAGRARTNLIAVLASGSLIATSPYTGIYSLTVMDTVSGCLLRFVAPTLNLLGEYQPGNVLRLGGSSALSGSYFIVSAANGEVTVASPTNGGFSGTTVMNGTQNPLSSFPLAAKTYEDVAAALNAYLPDNPIVTAEAIGTGFVPVLYPTYLSHPNTNPAPSGSSISSALVHHSFTSKYSGSAGIWQYDSSDPNLNAIKATVQSEDSLFPTVTEAAGTSYSPIGEAIVLVPTNSKTLQDWLNFNAASSMMILGEAARVSSGNQLQISSRADGSLGGVKVTGVTGNSLVSYVFGNANSDEYSTKLRVLSADAKSLVKGNLVHVENSVASEIMRPYRSAPTGTAITPSNPVNINTFFQPNQSIKYLRTSPSTARLMFYRVGQGPGQSEALTIGDTITLASLPNGQVQVVSTGGDLTARVGDMMYVTAASGAPADAVCESLTVNGYTDPSMPEYWGYPVVGVVDSKTVNVIAPNITTFGPFVLAQATGVVFLPPVYNEKNIQTNWQAGAKFNDLSGPGKMYYVVKALGGNMVSLWVHNTTTEATDTMLLHRLCVNTDDLITLGAGFDTANKGTFKIVAHNGRNHVIFNNPNGGKDEVIDSEFISGGGAGRREWFVGPIADGGTRAVRVTDAESIRVGDRLRISTPPTTSQWFPSDMFGSWRVTGMGYIGIQQATGMLTPVAADVTTGIKDGDYFTLDDGERSLVFEFDSNGAVSAVGRIAVAINPTDSAAAVANAIIKSINDLGADFGITATLAGSDVSLLNRRLDITSNVAITEVFANFGVTLTPVGMAGAVVDDGALVSFIDIELPNAPAEIYDSTTGEIVDKFLIAGNDSAIGFIEGTPFAGFRMVGGHSASSQVVEESELFLAPRLLTSKMSDTFGTKITALYKIGFEERTFQGIDGYKVFAGLIREAHRVIDGLPTNTILYPGVKALGAPVEVLPPLVKTVSIAMQVHPKDGVTINSISEIVKSTVAGYVNRLGEGKPVIISEIIRIVQGLPGVYSVSITGTMPEATDDRIVMEDIERARVLNSDTDITVG